MNEHHQIELFLAISISSDDPDDMDRLTFSHFYDLIEFVEELRMFNNIWLVPDEFNNIIISRSISKINAALRAGFFHFPTIYIWEYQNYEDAYSTALQMITNYEE